MNVRQDSAHVAGWKRAHALVGCPHRADAECVCRSQRAEYADVPPAQPGDAWRITSSAGHVVGYGLTCPNEACDQGVHIWSHAADCERRGDPLHLSCWTWTGSAEDGTLTASPSLWVARGCGWHGWLQNGEMRSV